MIASIDNCGSGLNADLSPEELGSGIWSYTSNVRFANGYVQRFKGSTQVFTTPSVTPYFIMPYSTQSKRYWVHAGLTSVYVDDGTTRTNITGTAPTGAADDRWTGGSGNGVLVINNSVDVPQYWAGTGTLAAMPGWDATWRTQSMRPFKNYWFAINVTKGSANYPSMIKWCNTLNPGAITAAGDWDATDPSRDAGEMDLAESPDIALDGLALGDVFIVYKERSSYAVSYCGAPYIFRIQKLPGDSGILSRGCVVNTPLGHVVMTAGDIVLNSGQGVNSIANGVIRDFVFKNIDQTNYKKSFVTANPQRNEVWICFPFGTSTACNKAAIWNWIDNTWSTRELSSVTYGAFGQISVVSSTSTWAEPGTWDTDATAWNENEYSPAEARLLMSHSTPMLSLVDTGTTEFGTLITAFAERTGITLGDASSVKTITGVRPKIDGNYGAIVNVQIGGSMYPDSAPVWGPSMPFQIGKAIKVNGFATGRFLGVRFSNADYGGWRMKSFDLEYENAGAF